MEAPYVAPPIEPSSVLAGEPVSMDVVDEAPMPVAEPPPPIRTLRQLPLAVIVKLDNVTTEYLPPRPCHEHSFVGPQRGCRRCDFREGYFAVYPQPSRGTFKVEVPDPGLDTMYELRVQRRQVPMTSRTASTDHTLQGVTAEPGLIFH